MICNTSKLGPVLRIILLLDIMKCNQQQNANCPYIPHALCGRHVPLPHKSCDRHIMSLTHALCMCQAPINSDSLLQ